MRQKLLTNLGRWAGERTWTMLAVVILLTLVFGGLSEQLEMTMDLSSLLPENDPVADEFNYIAEEFNGAATIFIVVQGEMDDMIAFARETSPMIEDLDGWIETSASEDVQGDHQAALDKVAEGKIDAVEKYIKRVEYRQPLDFIRDHGLLLIKPSDMENMREVFEDPNLLPYLTNLNNSLEKEYIQSDEKISTTQQEQAATQFLDGIESWVELTDKAFYEEGYKEEYGGLAADAAALGNPYLVSPDRSMLLIMAEPTFSMLDMDRLLPCVNGLEEMVKTRAADYNVTAGLAGVMALGRDEYVAGMEDSMSLTLLALVLILILFVVTFRMLSSPLLAILNLIIGITWAMGVSWLLVGTLNMFTAMMSVVLVGLGIDFSIHIISVFSELVNKGTDPKDAMVETMKKVGGGIMTGGLTTAAAFLTLVIGRSAGISEFGLVCGAGLIVIMVSTLLSLPTMLMVREKYRSWRGKELKKTRDVSYGRVGRLGESVARRWKFSLGALILVTIFFAAMAGRVTFDYNYLNMEPVGLESIELNDLIIEKFNFSADAAMMTARSLDENHRFAEEAKDKSSVSYVESITDYLPTDEEQARRKVAISKIAGIMESRTVNKGISSNYREGLLDEFRRLEANVMEIQDMAFTGGQDMVDRKANRLVGNPEIPKSTGNLSSLVSSLENEPVKLERLGEYNAGFGSAYRSLVLNMADTATIGIADLPEMIRSKHISKDGSRFLLTLYPKGNVWDMGYLETFTKEIMDISPSVSGTPPIFYYLLDLIGEDGKNASMLTIVVVVLFLWFDFRSLRKALLAMIPLLFGVVWMVGIMGLTGIQLTLLNIMAIPLIIGIGIDDGVHVIHRFHYEGSDAFYTVYSSTGKAIIITSLTTMLAFGSLVFATYRGFGSLGIALFIGVGTSLLASILVLPALLKITDGGKG